MGGFLEIFMDEMVGRLDGPMAFRMLLQPAMATLFAVRDGSRDSRERRAPYGWSLFTDPVHRRFLLRDGWVGVGKVFIVAVTLDFVYQYIVIGAFRPVQALLVAC